MTNDRLKRFIDSKDWRLYSAVVASVVVAGIGLYYLSSSTTTPPESAEQSGATAQQSGKEQSEIPRLIAT